ncbi:hypothetical protein [Butyrivibrio sp. NC2002]|uniref:hypothetical protein n=1 Tax=Butyrivibrio sp. NC2002 TaxID=1410610 RepID=UPI000564592B|nr:hypothetical protein [Butyrivibrio sp. NC2002]
MNRMQHNKSSLFLMELIIAILFFAISGAVCVRLFVNAHLLSNRSINVNNTCLWSQNVSEIFYSCRGDISKIASYYSENSIIKASENDPKNHSTLILFFDKDWEIINYPANDSDLQNEAFYEVILRVSKKNAADVYSDTAYSGKLDGTAALGEISILEVLDKNLIYEYPDENTDGVISTSIIDYYIGKGDIS